MLKKLPSFFIQNNKYILIFFMLLSVFVYSRSLDVHGLEYRDDEIFYFKSSQEMITQEDFISPKYFGKDRFQKPILYYWLLVLSFKIFGINWFAARIFSVLFAGFTVCLTWLIANRLFDKRTANLSSLILMTLPIFFRHARNAAPDIVLNFFVVLSLYSFIEFLHVQDKRKELFSILFFVSCGLGFMVKGYTAIVVPFLTVICFSIIARKPGTLIELRPFRGLVTMFVIILPWFVLMVFKHGKTYLDYLLVHETSKRLVDLRGDSNVIISKIKDLLHHSVFYLKVLFGFFAPWCFLLLSIVPVQLISKEKEERSIKGSKFLLIWMAVVFVFFSSLFAVLDHYLLVMATPFAVLLAYYLCSLTDNSLGARINVIVMKTIVLMIILLSFLIFSFIFVFLLQVNPVWILAGCVIPGFVLLNTMKCKTLHGIALILTIFLLIVYSQSGLISKAGLTPHSTLQKFAQKIHESSDADLPVGVGSDDIHEKEFQVYFDQEVKKVASNVPEDTFLRLKKFFTENPSLFCLLTEVDYERHIKERYDKSLDIVHTEYILRRKMYIDADFFKAIIKLDSETVRSYLMEKLILVKNG